MRLMSRRTSRWADPRRQSAQAVAEGASEKAPQVGAEGALDAALHHVQAPEEQRDRTGEIDQGQGSAHLPSPPAAWFAEALNNGGAGVDFNPPRTTKRVPAERAPPSGPLVLLRPESRLLRDDVHPDPIRDQ